jgi:DNA invertase Pin-like site-specific DNA recombinase
VAGFLVGYARCLTTSRDVRAQLSVLKQLGVTDEHLHTDRGRTGRNRERPGLTAALGAVRDGDVLVVTKLDRLGRSARDLHDIAAELAGKGIKLSIGGSIHDPGDPIGKMFFGMLALMAEFESDLIRSRTVEGMREAAKRGRLLGKPSKLSVLPRRRLLADYESPGRS